MKRRSEARGEPIKERRRKTPGPKRRDAPKAVPRSNSPTADLETEVVRLTRELNEAREEQTATSNVLQVISSFAGELEPVFQAILENATRICEANFGILSICEGEARFRVVAMHSPRGAPAPFTELSGRCRTAPAYCSGAGSCYQTVGPLFRLRPRRGL
jgi:hypothetical protein